MDLNIYITTVKDACRYGYNATAEKFSVWAGRGVVVLKAGYEATLPYLQNKLSAGIAVFAVTIIAYEIGDYFSELATKLLPTKTSEERAVKDSVKFVLISVIIASSVSAFFKYGKLPLGKICTIGISFFALMVYAPLKAPEAPLEVSKG